MRKLFISFLFLCVGLQLSAQTINWAINLTNVNAVSGTIIAVDNNDNLYGTGSFSGTINFDSKSLTATSATSDGFVVKFGSDSKTPVWVKAIKGTGANKITANCIAADSKGNIYVVGEFENSVTIDETTLTSDYADIYLIKLSSSGTVLAAKSFGFGAAPGISAVALDEDDNVYITGNFEEIITFGEETDAIENLSNNVYLTKFDENLTYQWTSYAVGASAFTAGKRIAFDSNNVFLIGSLIGSVTFAGYETSISSRENATTNSFLTKFSKENGSCIWAKSFGGTGSSTMPSTIDELTGISVRDGKIALTAIIKSLTVTLDGIQTSFNHKFETASTAPNGLVLFLTTEGEYISHQIIGDAGANNGSTAYAISIDSKENAYFVGDCSGTALFGTLTPIGKGGSDMYLSKYNITSGVFEYAHRFGADESEYMRSVALNNQDNIIYVHGFFRKRTGTRTGNPNVEMTGGGTPYPLTFGGSGTQTADNPFWARYDLPVEPNGVETRSVIDGSVYYNSLNNSLELNMNENCINVSIIDLSGKILFNKKLSDKKESIYLRNMLNGLYVVQVRTTNGITIRKLSVY